mmetsp:Transcript_24603/g.36108  ORF Transcript_24603/g.36108 Transcript_24603/m.36108 type:complete len:132 (-) Transcript_24603:53-448(-)
MLPEVYQNNLHCPHNINHITTLLKTLVSHVNAIHPYIPIKVVLISSPSQTICSHCWLTLPVFATIFATNTLISTTATIHIVCALPPTPNTRNRFIRINVHSVTAPLAVRKRGIAPRVSSAGDMVPRATPSG